MSIHRYQSFWRSLTFNRIYDSSGMVDDPAHIDQTYGQSDYRLESADITRIQVADYRELRQWLEGSEPNEAFEGYRLIEGRGTIIGSTVADLEDKTWAMYEAFSPAACRIAFANNTPPGLEPFIFRRATAAGGSLLQRFYCRPGSGRPVVIGRMREGLSRRFVWHLLALDPFAYNNSATVTTITAGGTVTNAGNIYTRPTITIVTSAAGAANFTLTNTTTGQSVVIDLSGFAASTYVIDVQRGTITRSGATVYSKLVSGFLTNLWLAAGANVWTVANATNVTSISVSARDAYA